MNSVYCKLFFGICLDYFDVCEVVEVIQFGVYVKLFYIFCVFVENLVCCCDLVILEVLLC